jgi:hypothetical protein
MKSKGAARVAAHVFLRSVSGKSILELGHGPVPADLSPYLPLPATRERVCEMFRIRGFSVFVEDSGLTMSIEGPPRLFTKTFGMREGSSSKALSLGTTELSPPQEMSHLVERITLIPAPELFGQGGG